MVYSEQAACDVLLCFIDIDILQAYFRSFVEREKKKTESLKVLCSYLMVKKSFKGRYLYLMYKMDTFLFKI